VTSAQASARVRRSGARAVQRGFTLLEVMMAMALLALAMAALSDLTGNALRNYAYSRDLTNATMLAADGSFEDQGFPNYKWKLEVVKPTSELSPDQLVALLAGAGDDPDSSQKLMAQLFGGGKDAGSGGGAAAGGMPALFAASMQAMVTNFGDLLKKSVRQLKFSVAWKDGKTTHQFAISSLMVVACPKAPGGRRGDAPDLCLDASGSTLQSFDGGNRAAPGGIGK
jgi:prepilin-type N-terminal cleavage/methylation domain-containing protein